MRRGLISWSRGEQPEAVFARRVERAQAALARAELDALVIYTNCTRPAGVGWLCGFIPYWSEGLAVLTRSGGPRLVVALSKRVADWIAATACVDEIVCTPQIGREAARLIAASAPRARVGVLELDDLPGGWAAQLAADGATLQDATALVDDLRSSAEPSEIALAVRAAEIAADALAAAPVAGEVAAAVAAVDAAARRAGAEDVFVAVAPDADAASGFVRAEGRGQRLARRAAARASVAYKGQWVRAIRSFGADPDERDRVRRATVLLADAVARLPDTSAFAGATSWTIEGSVRSQPLEWLAGRGFVGSRVPLEGKVVSAAATFAVDGVPVVVGGAALVGRGGIPGALLVGPREG